MIRTGLPVVSCPYIPAAEMPIACWPRLMRSRWNFEPYKSFAKIGGICWRTMPGPLSATVIRKRVAWLAGGGGPPLATGSSLTTTSGRIPASSQASSALSTASFTHVSSAFRGLSNPSRWRFLVKNSETEISRWRAPISTAVTVGLGGGAGVTAGTGGEGLTLRLAAAKGSLAYAPIETKSRAWAKFYRRHAEAETRSREASAGETEGLLRRGHGSHRGGGAAELARPQPRERAAIPSQQLRGRPFLEEGAIVEDDDAVG